MAARSCVVASLLLAAKAVMTSPEFFTTSPEGKTIFMVPLDKQHVPVMSEGRQVAVKTAYYGQMFAGGPRPQNFTVVFDTGSGHLFVPSAACKDEACVIHKRYDADASKTSIGVNHDGSKAKRVPKDQRDQVSISYGTGEIVGDFQRETICIGMSSAAARAAERAVTAENAVDASNDTQQKKKAPANCARVRLISALKMASEPFSAFFFDGVVGLGLPALALHPEFHFFGQLSNRLQIAPVFSFFLSRSDDVRSEIAFGGLDPKRMAGGQEAVKYVPVLRPEEGYWRVQIQGVRVGNTPLSLCDNGACTAIADTGTSLLGVPSESFNDLIGLTVRKLSEHVASSADVDGAVGLRTQVPESEWPDCREVPGPSLTFDMGDFEIVLEAEDYTRPVAMDVDDLEGNSSNVTHSVCRASFLPVDMPPLGKNVFIWGEPILRKYYTSYDFKGQRIGFVAALHPLPEEIKTSTTATAQAANDTVLEV